jgi:hypothetical protein
VNMAGVSHCLANLPCQTISSLPCVIVWNRETEKQTETERAWHEDVCLNPDVLMLQTFAFDCYMQEGLWNSGLWSWDRVLGGVWSGYACT